MLTIFLMEKKNQTNKQTTATTATTNLKSLCFSDRAVEVFVLAIVSLDAHARLC